MASDNINQIVQEKLDKNNFHARRFRITNFLMGKGYWEYIEGEHEEAPRVPKNNPSAEQLKAFKDWNQGARKVMYWLCVSIHDTMIGHIQDAYKTQSHPRKLGMSWLNSMRPTQRPGCYS